MKIQDDYLLVYARKDSQRLKETFFSNTPEKTSRDNVVLFALGALVIFCTIAGVILSRYDLFLVKRAAIDIPQNSLSILNGKNTRMEVLTAGLVERKGATLYAALPPKAKAGIKLNFAQPLDIRDKSLMLYLRCDEPMTIEAVIKDSRFLSNARTPFLFNAQKSLDENYAPTSLDFAGYLDNRINLNDIRQMTLYFYPKNEGSRIFIKDMILAGKNSK